MGLDRTAPKTKLNLFASAKHLRNVSITTSILGLILLVLIFIGRDVGRIRSMIFEARMCTECHGTGEVPEEKRDFPGIEDWTCAACKGIGKKP